MPESLEMVFLLGKPVERSPLFPPVFARLRVAGGCDVVIKAIDGGHGRGAGVVFVRGDDWPCQVLLDGPLLVEPRIADDGVDRKLYIAGDACRGLLKPWPCDALEPTAPFTPLSRAWHAGSAPLSPWRFSASI